MPMAPSARNGSAESGAPGSPGVGIPVATSPTVLTPYSASGTSVPRRIPSTSTISGPGIRRAITRRMRMIAREIRPMASVYLLVSESEPASWTSCSGSVPLTPATPRSFGIWPTMM